MNTEILWRQKEEWIVVLHNVWIFQESFTIIPKQLSFWSGLQLNRNNLFQENKSHWITNRFEWLYVYVYVYVYVETRVTHCHRWVVSNYHKLYSFSMVVIGVIIFRLPHCSLRSFHPMQSHFHQMTFSNVSVVFFRSLQTTAWLEIQIYIPILKLIVWINRLQHAKRMWWTLVDWESMIKSSIKSWMRLRMALRYVYHFNT
jgi:hypothetical protein